MREDSGVRGVGCALILSAPNPKHPVGKEAFAEGSALDTLDIAAAPDCQLSRGIRKDP